MVTELVFCALVTAVAVQRMIELRLSRKHENWLFAQGAREHAPGHFRWMQALHAAWLIAMPLEVLLLEPPFVPWLALVAFAVFAAGQALRYTARKTLGRRWTVRILTLQGVPAVDTGIYRYLRHPNYLGVILEIAALPLVHTAWRTALLFSVANAIVLAVRIRAEERALYADGEYADRLGRRARLVPKLSQLGRA
jgi:methyltransferase